MVNSVLEVAIGLAFVFLVFSLVVSGMHEGLARLLSWRSKALWAAIRQMVDGDGVSAHATLLKQALHVAPTAGDPRPNMAAAEVAMTNLGPEALPGNVTTAIYAHPLVAELEKLHTKARSKIERLPSDQFAGALIDVLVPDGNGETSVAQLKERLQSFPDTSPLKRPLLFLVSEAGDSLETLRTKVGGWFDGQMDRLSERYRRRAKWWLLGFGLVVAVAFNIDSLYAAQRLYKDDALRAAVVAQAETVTTACTDKTGTDLSTCIREHSAAADNALTPPVGWTHAGGRAPLLRGFGWVLTGFALMQGAPFWFNLLSRATAWRKARSEGSEPASQ